MESVIRASAALLSVILFVLLDYLSIRWVETTKWMYIPLLVLVSLAATRLFGWVGTQTSLSVTSGLINTGIVLGSIVVGITIRHDTLDLQQRIGLAFGVLAIALLTIRFK